jgi:hypothetical protein
MFKTEAPSRIQGDRTCRDVFFLIVFAAFWVGMLAVAGIGFSKGDPGVLVFGLDYRGNLCGKDNDGGLNLEGYDYRYWPNSQEIAELGSIQMMDAKSICLKSCPKPAEAVNGTVQSVNWVCDYPDDGHVADMTMQQWSDASYDYFDRLNETSKESSKKFMGPCYRTITTHPLLPTAVYTQTDVALPLGADARLKRCWAKPARLAGTDPFDTEDVSLRSDALPPLLLVESVKGCPCGGGAVQRWP